MLHGTAFLQMMYAFLFQRMRRSHYTGSKDSVIYLQTAKTEKRRVCLMAPRMEENGMQENDWIISVFTRQPDADAYPEGLARAVHFSWKRPGEAAQALNRNYGILFAKGEISPEDTIVPMGVREPRIFDMDGGTIGISAHRVHENGEEDAAHAGEVLLWTTCDLIHFEECGFVKEEDTEKWHPGTTLSVRQEIAECAAAWWNPVHAVRVRIPEQISAEKREALDDIRASVWYSDGSCVEKRIEWDTESVDFAKPGVYLVKGRIRRPAFPFPLARGYGDPVIFPWEGRWYFLATNDNLDDIGLYIREAESVEGLFREGIHEHLILPFDPVRGFEQTFWAPEFHVIGGEAFILFAVSGHTWGPQCHLMRLKKGGKLTDPAAWEDPVRVVRMDGSPLSSDGITLDMTYIRAQSGSYMVWSYRRHIGTPMDTGSMLYIARVSEETPWQLTSEPVLLTRPLYGWENVAGTINNEGPHAFVREGKVYLAYSGGSANAYTYALGLLTVSSSSDLLNPESWDKSIAPVLTFYSVPGEYGPGHHSFYTNDDGELMIAYHGETGLHEQLRCDGIRRIHFRGDGTPYFQMAPEEDLPEKERAVCTELTVTGTQSVS